MKNRSYSLPVLLSSTVLLFSVAISILHAAEVRIPTDLNVEGALRVAGAKPAYERTYLVQEGSQPYAILPQLWRVHDAPATVLPGTSAADDLGVYAGTFGTGAPYVATYDVKAAGTQTLRARTLFQLPPEYVSQQAAAIRAYAGMLTTISDGTATLDFEAFKLDRSGAISGTDLVTTSATTINSLSFAAKDFGLSPNTLSPGDWIDIRVTIVVSDTATATAVRAALATVEMLLSIKG